MVRFGAPTCPELAESFQCSVQERLGVPCCVQDKFIGSYDLHGFKVKERTLRTPDTDWNFE